MAQTVRKIDYYYVSVSDKPGEASCILSYLQEAGVNLLGFSGFPEGARKAQLDFLPEDPAAFAKAARQAGLKLSKKKTGFLIQGEDSPGALAGLLAKLAQRRNMILGRALSQNGHDLQYDRLADHFRYNLDMDLVYNICCLDKTGEKK